MDALITYNKIRSYFRSTKQQLNEINFRSEKMLSQQDELKNLSDMVRQQTEEIRIKLDEVAQPKEIDKTKLFTRTDKFNIEWMEKYSIPQSLQFMIDLIPYIQKQNSLLPWNTHLEVLDIGTATGAGANLLGQLNNAELFGTPMKVDAMDIDGSYKRYADAMFPFINYMVEDIFKYNQSKQWDIVICSHCIEHFHDPTEFILEIKRRTRGWALFYAPYNEKNLLKGHLRSITDEFVDKFNPVFKEVITSKAWKHPNDEESKCIIFVLESR